ncbi:phytanoyl-CoA dioxygenase family protein [Paenibacillus ginsengarvi]|uniref:Phytanoyl-CoA dioxygenase family protein n=1 Tax=Paenibacillus ginsengarvi TaxID=400777 RepID=A0A3B0C4Q6_9BACL|nr:phytanoyl-CoA dioxygenase family protein [Paenibacillus ginsengarvi]RKN80480.1 phytanoyl-CoA dioxygenase family protein [Paenibacillus ginsengarvi]
MATTSLLTEQDVQNYKDQGYLLYNKPVFSEEKLARLTGIFEEHLIEKGKKLSDELDTPHFRDERLLEFLLSDEVLDLVEPIIGPNIMLWSSHFICKDPLVGRATPWHEDSAYWKGRLDNYDKIVTVWLAIDRSTEENGCMRVIPGTHVNGFSEYEQVDKQNNLFGSQIKNVDESKAVYFNLERGECSLHDSRIMHGAKPNTSEYRRCGYTMRYLPASTKLLEGKKNDGFKVWLARGKDMAGNSYANV